MKAVCLAFSLAVSACGDTPPAGHRPIAPENIEYRLEAVASNLQVPWSIVFAPDGRILFTERPGRIRVIEKGKLKPDPLHTFKDVASASETGLMGLCLHPDFAKNHFIYASYANTLNSVRVVRFKETSAGLSEMKIIVDALPSAPNHAGCRIKFGPDGKLYITTGDATDRRIAQQLLSLGGKTLRVNDDGSFPEDNPFAMHAAALPHIWSYGHRNAQGMDWQPGTGLMFQTEHGPSGFDGPGGGDEVNIVEKGKNYGWPTIHHTATQDGLVSPLLEFTPAEAPASGAFYSGDKLPQFKGNFFFGCLRGEGLMRVVLDGRKVVRHEKIITDMGRIRDVAQGPDGYLYFSTSNEDGRGRPAADDDRIMRIVPK
ncbi:MAG: PQQ-dependent sugar dehydrogenase [Fimbriimonadales bacterium]